MRCLFATLLLLGITTPMLGQDIKPGTPEWDRRFSELRKKSEQLRKQRSSSSSSGSKFRSSIRRPTDKESDQNLERLRMEREQRELEAIPAKYRKAFVEAQNPPALDRANTPSVERTIAHLRTVMSKAKTLEEIIPYLSAPFRQRYIQLLSGQNYGNGEHTPEGELAYYKHFFRTITEYDRSQASENKNFAYGYVWSVDKSEVLYQLEFVGEGRLWRLNGWKPQAFRN